MKKVWSYIAIFFVGLSAGLVTMYKLAGATVKVEVRKIKNKRIKGKTDTSIPINIEVPKKRLKRTRKERKQDRLDKRYGKL